MNLQVQDLGLCSYKEVWDLQKNIHADRIAGKDQDTLLLVEHTPVYTFGKNADENHLLQHYPENVPIFHIERGGDITFHGPGQLVGYPILDLNNYKKSISWYMRSLEQVIIDTLNLYGLEASRKDGLTGVWIGDEKIAALGVRISRWVTMHGFALNVNTDLNYYDGIIPCGILEYGVTSMEKLLDHKISMDDIKNNLISCFRNIFINELIPMNS
ncbi:MAG TPA: lipoyl(octanoyl) transferase LipB [Candidatus Marinimicrobia bacterium]|jgi:lipoyl(octanoyl) transferase|nr:lipoyl(octanoyl) transferase [Candidatus Neomarinimicrobiota bacterium]MDP6143552.1 lipoyl(octanoyl) transferase LipB [Candidatus Neomarinimicrobiota bacterium]MDP6261674.1 lipoyl(octanoyl) transferase LipB [Candidatus Neomarinimicrobiota bacterium]MDP7126794.1 lipoyl(octanoyl) transferase LipB [Candidatus Neomarinimicrobiota bacterium]MDP7474901.1 lipoyl(octanoyl) transferase LipB [Candidatus Neomarinimicrobiota bacterium]|tara:strand:- start:631 stop:1272 length:642 start_codon:yes stop_codon:yes gene_type:complete